MVTKQIEFDFMLDDCDKCRNLGFGTTADGLKYHSCQIDVPISELFENGKCKYVNFIPERKTSDGQQPNQ